MASSCKWELLGETRKQSVSKPVVKEKVVSEKVVSEKVVSKKVLSEKKIVPHVNLFVSPSADIQYYFTDVSFYHNNCDGQLFPLVDKRRAKSPYIVNQVNRFSDNIVRYIYLLTLLSNEKRWKKNHKRLMWKSFQLISFEKNNEVFDRKNFCKMDHNEKWMFWEEDGIVYQYFVKKKTCDAVNHKYVNFVNIDDNIADLHDIKKSKYEYNGQYWFHDNCRCRNCDFVRVSRMHSTCKSVGSQELHSKIRNKYHSLKVDLEDTCRWYSFEYPFELGWELID